jgi:beta-aspartyl-peptidase (threonine type)
MNARQIFSWSVILCAIGFLPTHLTGQDRVDYAIVIHGGAGSAKIDPEVATARIRSLTTYLELGVEMLKADKQSLQVVEAVIRQLEDDPLFNAGHGAVYNSQGGHELDASIMDGRDLSCGAVAGVTRVKNPISLARHVMTDTRHVLLAADGADQFARQLGLERVKQSYFHTEHARQRWEKVRAAELEKEKEKETVGVSEELPSYLGTVGCVVLDREGSIAAGTSTGGLTNKKYGRVGDSPIISAGTYADNRTCGVSGTGIGEHFIRHAVAYDVSARMMYRKDSLQDAARAVIHETLKPGYGGIIALDRVGNISMEFNTAGMSRAAADSNGRFEVHVGK